MKRIVLLLVYYASVVSAVERPNVLLILVDDLKPNLGCYGDKHAISPNIDRLAARGLRFDNAYCNQAVCAPSRFTYMLGSHATSSGLYDLGSHLRQIWPDAVTLPQHFAKYGQYRTESLGKVFHVGHGNYGDPDSFMVPHFKDKVVEYILPESTEGGKLTREEALFTNQELGNIRNLPRGAAWEAPDVADDAYADGRVVAETGRRLKAAADRRRKEGTPFFMATGIARPHLPFCVPKRYWDLYDPGKLPMPEREVPPLNAPAVAGKQGGEIAAYTPVPVQGEYSEELKRNLIHGYYASMSYADAQIGKLVDALDENGLSDSTIVVLWGDHGWHLGDLGIWTKHTNYEQANRIPLLIIAPGVAKPGSVSGQMISTVDLYPTLAELAGLPAPKGPQPIDGVSMAPVLKNPDVRVRDHIYHIYPRGRKLGRAIRTERYRLVEWKGYDNDPNSIEYELYDYQQDKVEQENIYAKNPEVAEKLKKILAGYPAAVPRSGFNPRGPDVVGKVIKIRVEVDAENPDGVVLAQGGRETGYAVYFKGGEARFDVRIDGEVTGLSSGIKVGGKVKIEAELNREKMLLKVNDRPQIQVASPGLLKVQPKDGLSIGFDDLSAAGGYESPNRFNGTIIKHSVRTE